MTGIGIGIRFVALIAMQIVSSPKRPKLKPVGKSESAEAILWLILSYYHYTLFYLVLLLY